MVMKIVEIIGSPASGKSSLSRKIYEYLLTCNANPHLLSFETVNIQNLRRDHTKKRDMFLRVFLVVVIAFRTLTCTSWMKLGKNLWGWIAWLRRVSAEWIDCVIHRRLLLNGDLNCDVAICDSRILGKYLFEMADPRNMAGLKIFNTFLFGQNLMPVIPVHELIVTKMDHKDVMRFAGSRSSNPVRKELSDEEREKFFKEAQVLSDLILKSKIVSSVENLSNADVMKDELEDRFSKENILKKFSNSLAETSVVDNTFFILGDARSGTTYFANEMAKATHVAIPPECNLLSSALETYGRDQIKDTRDLEWFVKGIFGDPKFSDWKLTREEVLAALGHTPFSTASAVRRICMLYCRKHCPDAKVFGIKKNVIFKWSIFDKVLKVFPEAPILWVMRDGRAVFQSKKKSIESTTGRPFEEDPMRAAAIWVQKNYRLEQISEHYGRTKLIRYEDLMEFPDKTLHDAYDFIGFPQRRLLDTNTPPNYIIPDRYGELHENVGKPPIQDRMTAWEEELSTEEIAIFELVAGKELMHFGYVSNVKRSFLWRLVGRGYLVGSFFWGSMTEKWYRLRTAFLFVLSRFFSAVGVRHEPSE